MTQGRDKLYQQLSQLDVVLSTHGSSLFNGFTQHVSFRRLIIDECHLVSGSQWQAIKGYRVPYVWGVTGTPFSTSPTDVASMALILGQWNDGLCLHSSAFIQERRGTQVTIENHGDFPRFVDSLRKLMIRLARLPLHACNCMRDSRWALSACRLAQVAALPPCAGTPSHNGSGVTWPLHCPNRTRRRFSST